MIIPRENIVVDCLAIALASNTSAGLVTIETIHRIKSELGVNITLGASNVSFVPITTKTQVKL